MKLKKQPALACPFDNIGASDCLMVAFSGFYESHEPLPLDNVGSIVPARHQGHQKLPAKGFVCIVVLFAIALAAIWGNTE